MTHWEGFYVPPDRIHGDEVTFPPEEVRHLVFVLRKKMGDKIWAVDGRGTAHEVELVRLARKEARGRILRSEQNVGESPCAVTLAAGALKGERFDWLVEKAVELGVRSIIPFLSEGTLVRTNAPRVRRWRNLAIAAMKQSGRSVLPDVDEFRNLEYVLKDSSAHELRLAAHPGEGSVPMQEAFQSLPHPPKSALLLVGPEGGFVQREINLLEEHDFVFVSLGPRRLRAETAGMVLLSRFMMLAGDLTGFQNLSGLLSC
jgi:16S rRNA (uracil1498-N3)-methyltransferase